VGAPGWYRTFFRGPALDFWRAVTTPEFTREQARGIRAALALAPGERVLDVPCGNGRLALELAGQGLSASGIDLASDFVDEGRRAARERGLAVELVRGDMRELPWTGAFDAAFCVGNSFGYLEHEGNVAFLAAVARALVPGGRFLLEYPMVAEIALTRPEEREALEFGGIRMEASSTYDVPGSRIDTTYTFVRGSEAVSGTASYQIYTCRELVTFLSAAGFATVEFWGGIARTPFTRGKSEVLYALARR
jgi:SAM-dependent methyltransferase